MDSIGSSAQSDLDHSFTDQELEAIDAIEAAFVASSSSSSIVKRDSTSQEDQHHQQKDRRKLPDSILYLCKPLATCQDSVKMRYPEIKFGGRILYSRTSVQVEKAARELLRSLKAKQGKTGKVTIGFDIEWKPSFTKGKTPSRKDHGIEGGIPLVFSLEKPKAKLLPFKGPSGEEENPSDYINEGVSGSRNLGENHDARHKSHQRCYLVFIQKKENLERKDRSFSSLLQQFGHIFQHLHQIPMRKTYQLCR